MAILCNSFTNSDPSYFLFAYFISFCFECKYKVLKRVFPIHVSKAILFKNSSSNLATLVDSLRQIFFAKNLDSLLVELVGPTNNYISIFIYSQTCNKGHLYITNHLFIKGSLIFPINE